MLRFLAEGLLRAPKQLWGNLSPTARKQVVTELKRSRVIKPNESNWLLFASIVEAALQEFTGECDTTYSIMGYASSEIFGIKETPSMETEQNSTSIITIASWIHPMLTDVLVVMQKHRMPESEFLNVQQNAWDAMPNNWSVSFLRKEHIR